MKLNREMSVRQRFFRVATIFFKMFIDYNREFQLVKNRGYAYAQNKMKRVHEKRARELYETAVSMGGVLIKLCQFFSARRDVFPDAYIKILAPLQDNVPPVSFEAISEIIHKEYGDHGKYFACIESAPLASASLGQTHRARLHDGREVVLKILKPGIEKLIDTDFAILHFVFQIMSHFKVFREHADFFDILAEFVRVTGDELNFRREMHICKEFKRGLAKYDYILVPEIYEEFCTDRIIVMEYLEGDRINNIEAWSRRNNDPVILARRIIEIYVEQFLTMSLIHFDPHPGNILISKDNNIILLDFGMSGEITGEMRRGVADFLEALLKRDARKIVETLNALGFIRKGANRYSLLPVIDFFIDEILDTMKLDRESYYNVDFSPIRDDLVELIYTQPFAIPIEWAYIGKTLGTIAGIISQLHPEFNIYGELKLYADRLISSSIRETVRRTLASIKENVVIAAAMPGRIYNFMDNLERGSFRMKVDYGEVFDKVDEIKTFIIKIISFTLGLACGISAYVFYWAGNMHVTVMFACIGFISFLFFLIYRKRNIKDRIKKYF